MIKETILWETSDGTLHKDENSAQEHEGLISITESFPDIHASLNSVNNREFIKWVKENKEYCANLFRALLQTVLKDY